MATTLDEIADLFLMLQTDYKLTTLFETSGSAALNLYLEPWLLMSIDEFDYVCNQALIYTKATQTFSVDLNSKNKNILAQIMVKYWLQKEINNVLQMNLFIQDKDFKTHSAASNLKEKRELYNAKVEEISQLLLNYALLNNDWDSWDDQNFD